MGMSLALSSSVSGGISGVSGVAGTSGSAEVSGEGVVRPRIAEAWIDILGEMLEEYAPGKRGITFYV